jgi:hypothetical protein
MPRSPNAIVQIYLFIDARPGVYPQPAYVGQTEMTLKQRLGAYGRSTQTPVLRWITELKEERVKPETFVLEWTTGQDADEREDYWIARLRDVEGITLLNRQPGGQYFGRHCDETRRSMSEGMKRSWERRKGQDAHV